MYRKRSLYNSDLEHQNAKRDRANLRQKRYRNRLRRKKNSNGRGYFPFKHVLPIWSGWTPELYRRMMKECGYALPDVEDILNFDDLYKWEDPKKKFRLFNELNQRITHFAEMNGWWHLYPYPPSVILVFAREVKEYKKLCLFYNLSVEEARWIRKPGQLAFYSSRQVKAVLVAKKKKLRGMHLHPVTKRILKTWTMLEKRPLVFSSSFGKRTF